jgi:hypothetical protein
MGAAAAGGGMLSVVVSDPNLGAAECDVSPSAVLPNLNVDDDGAGAGAPPKEKPPGAAAGAGPLDPKAGTAASVDGCEPKVVGAAAAGAEPPKENAGVEAGAEDVLPPNDGAEEESPSSLPSRRLLLRSSLDAPSLGTLPSGGTIVLVSFAAEDGCSPNLNDDAGAASPAGAGVLPNLKPVVAPDDPLPPKEKDAPFDESVLSSEALLAELGTLTFPPLSGRVRLLVGSVAGIGRFGAFAAGVDDVGKTNDFGASSLFFSSPDTLNLKGFFSPFVGAGAGADANEKPIGFAASWLSEPFDSVDVAGAGALPNENAGGAGAEEEPESLAGAGAAAGEAAGAAPNLNPPPPPSPLLVEAGGAPKVNPPPLGGADAEGAGALPKEKPPVAGAGADEAAPKENPPAPIVA